MGGTTRRTALATATLVLLGGIAPATAAGPIAAPTAVPVLTGISCGVTWGSLAKNVVDARVGDGTITDLRAGRHTCFDRTVIDVAGIVASKIGYHVRYVDTVHAPGSGRAVPLAGGARMQVDVTVPAHTPRAARPTRRGTGRAWSTSPVTTPSGRSRSPGRSRAGPPSGSGCGPGCPCGSSCSTAPAPGRG